ncbi:hypothetical protein SAMN04488514_10533 [Kriegella aquimaris]|uniref:Uncharacterized protein n=1 Tax=Kriegella aquimaris TaxID=192904 RepID=A0A1G9QIQ9_9FLAO|nr:hypothetical protein SAMN04488514_10533 [Kriegella aquimaris]
MKLCVKLLKKVSWGKEVQKFRKKQIEKVWAPNQHPLSVNRLLSFLKIGPGYVCLHTSMKAIITIRIEVFRAFDKGSELCMLISRIGSPQARNGVYSTGYLFLKKLNYR